MPKRADGRYERKVTVGHTPDGKPIRRSVYGETASEVRDKQCELLAIVGRGAPAPDRRMTVRAFLLSWSESVENSALAPKTKRRYQEHVVQHLIPSLGHHILEDLSVAHVEGMMRDKLKEAVRGKLLKARTINGFRATLRVALNWGLRDELVRRNVAGLATPLKTRKKRVMPLKSEEARGMIAAVRETRLECFIVVGLALGMRVGEILALRWSVIDLDHAESYMEMSLQRFPPTPVSQGFYFLKALKTDAARTVNLPAFAVAALQGHRARQSAERLQAGSLWQEPVLPVQHDDEVGDPREWPREPVADLVFTTEFGLPRNGDAILHQFQRALSAHGVRRMTLHEALRHGAATLLRSAGASMEDVQALLGHSQISLTTDLYGHIGADTTRRVANRMDDILSGV